MPRSYLVKKICIAIIFILSPQAAFAADDNLLDFWAEEIRLFGTANRDGQWVDHDLDDRRSSTFRTNIVSLDHSDHKVGDLSLIYSPKAADMPQRFGFVSGLWGEEWSLPADASLTLWVKVEGRRVDGSWAVQLVDANARVAKGELRGVSKEWSEISVPRSAFSPVEGFDWDSVRTVEFRASLGEDARVYLDGVRFVAPGGVIGITDKSLDQRMREAKASRAIRIADGFQRQARIPERDLPDSDNGAANPIKLTTAFAKMMVGEDLETANRFLREELEKSSVLTVWSLFETPIYIRFYNYFSTGAGKYPGRLSPEVEALLLETLWERNEVENDIALTRQSTWWMQGSENHDLQAKGSSLGASAIFKDADGYSDRVYPNLGFGAGYHYGHAGYYGPGGDFADKQGGGRADLSDGKDYTPAEQYAAWVDFFGEYITERGKRGFFLEHASRGYAKHSLGFLDLAAMESGDPELQLLWHKFYSVYWADWAQTSISGTRGGPKTRHHRDVGGPGDVATADLVSFHLGGPANASVWHYWNLLNGYELPPVLWRMILDREGMGEFTYLSRGVGEEENVWPRPLGNERSLLVETESRFLRSTYVTPDYTLGTQMDHPAAVHSHLSIAGRWHGMTVAQSPLARIVPVGLPSEPDAVGRPPAEWDMETMLHTAHDENTLVLQQSRRWYAVHPEWFPADAGRYDKDIGVWFGDDWDKKVERDGWVFVRKGNTYAAVRPVTWDADYERSLPSTGVGNQINFNKPYDPPTVRILNDSYSWNDAGTIMQLKDRFAPVIVEAGTVDDYASLDVFMKDVLDNRLELHKTVVPGYHVMVYVPSGNEGREIVFNAGAPEIPTVGGTYIDYSHPMTFDSPHFQSVYKSGVVTLRFADEELVIDFTE
ncbi:hypothetical protein [Aquisalinus flavus]|uniref:Uncharacterized protein n=1 Tax=Aquisalinus flavus TaxID=1526572 RepID=A0A8J2Y6M2_9PROT|nr:hypothetical protein [Aquisalinus flavus]MBD0425970.1 hypothetical protein [Aquisalinus flavus]UNE48438.1 hypothetical protein FF099_10455 [Aquisalinus flavus]GGD11780.1 hypothetical protein GCM10011342_20730 [Aquisalinus flavus]